MMIFILANMMAGILLEVIFIACLILVVSGVWLVGYIDVNKRFPKPEQQVHSIGEWVRTGDTSIKVNSVEYMPQEEANSQYGVGGSSRLLPPWYFMPLSYFDKIILYLYWYFQIVKTFYLLMLEMKRLQNRMEVQPEV